MSASSIPLLPFSGSLRLGGSTTFLINLARAFREQGLKLPVVGLTEHHEHSEDFEAAGAEVSCISTRRMIYEDRLRWGYQQALRYQPRAVLACLSGESFEMLRLVPPGVVRMGIIQSDDPGPYGLPRAYGRWLDVMIGVSDQIAEKLRAMPECRHLRVESIPYGIHFPPAIPRETPAAGAPLRIVYVGRIIEIQKRISRLAALIQLAQQRKLNAHFTIVGSGPDDATFRAAVQGCNNVELLGSVPNQQIAPLLRQQDVFVLLSDFEGLPLALLEAMGDGVVPVISDLESGIRNLVSLDCGVRVPVGGVEAAYGAIAALATDRVRRNELSRAATQKARAEYSATRMAGRYLKLIDEMCGGKPAPVWPKRIVIPAPLGVSSFLYSGASRVARRLLKKLGAG